MVNLIIAVIVLLLMSAAVIYMIKAKKNGHKCIGCPSGCSCSSHHNECHCEDKNT